ncbi:MAG: lamin tail domain-containing protein [Actinomycetia bacterium]|nr:lamin tail domain-containing protein [Actinomycetes bacterium]
MIRSFTLVAVALTLVAAACSDAGTDLPSTTTAEKVSTVTVSPSVPTTTEPATMSTEPSSDQAEPLVPLSSVPAPDGEAALVVSVVDGDTVVVEINGVEERVRLIGINTPESGECLADGASVALQEIAAGRDVILSGDVNDRDMYGRLLRYMWVDDIFVNETMVGNGLAVARRYEPDTALADLLEVAQDIAREQGRGMWGANVCGVGVDADVVIVDVQYDAPGNDNDNLNGEWVTIENRGDVRVDLSNWVLKDESASHRYTFNSGFEIEGGTAVVVYSGCGVDSTSELYWCNSGSAVWNNSGDTGFLLDPLGNIMDTYGYSP